MDFWRKANEELSNIVDRIGDSVKRIQHKYTNHSMSTGEIKHRMAGVPIFRVSNYAEDVPVHVSGEFNLCFISKNDAKTFLDKLKTENNLPSDFRVIYNPLGDLLLNEENVIPIRLVPESSQIKNALQVKEKDNKHTPDKNSSITGVPVFKVPELKWVADGTEEHFCPAYLRMEDLLEELNELQCSHATIEVTSLEETIKEMKNSSTNKSNDILFRGLGAPR